MRPIAPGPVPPPITATQAEQLLAGLERTLSAEQLAQVLALIGAINATQAARLVGGDQITDHSHPASGGGPVVTASDPIWFPDQLTTYQLELPAAVPVDVAELVLMAQVAYLTDMNSSTLAGWERDGAMAGHFASAIAGLAPGQILYAYSGGPVYAEIESVTGDGTAPGSVLLKDVGPGEHEGDDVPSAFYPQVFDQETATYVPQAVVPASNPSSSSGTWKAWRDSTDPESVVNFRFAGGISAPTKAVLLAIDYRQEG